MLDFLGIGAQKAGTTWLFEMLAQHPDVSFPHGKEIHFWDALEAGKDISLDWYRGLFAGGGPKKGEITPAYALLNEAILGQVAALNPDLRVLYLIRNPKERAWSSALMALGRAEMTEPEASDRWFIDHFQSQGSRQRGDYEVCIRRWRGVFGSDRVLVARYESIREQPRELLKQCARHIGVEPGFYDSMEDEALSRPVFAGSGTPVRDSLAPILEALYDRRIQRLGEYLGDDLTRWLEWGRGKSTVEEVRPMQLGKDHNFGGTGTLPADTKALLVLGMHRSGTSALAGVFQRLGVELGERLVAPAADNPRGFWENRDIVAIHDQVLHTLNSWHEDIRPLPDEWWRREDMAAYREAIRKVVYRDLSGGAIWAVKDPRLCRLLPLWRPLLEAPGLEPACAFIIRSPREVAASLSQRNGFSTSRGLLLWLLHNLEAITAAEGLPGVIVSYDRLMEDWRQVIDTVGRELDIQWPRTPEEAEQDIAGFLEPGLRHHSVGGSADPGPESVETGDPFLVEAAAELWETLKAHEGGPLSQVVAPARALLARLAEELFSQELPPVVDESFGAQGVELDALRGEIGEKNRLLAEKEQAFKAQAANIQAQAANIQALRDEHQRQVEEKHRQIARLDVQLKTYMAEVKGKDAEIKARDAEIRVRDVELDAFKQSRLYHVWRALHHEPSRLKRYLKVAYLGASMVTPEALRRRLRPHAEELRHRRQKAKSRSEAVAPYHARLLHPVQEPRRRVVHAIANFLTGGSSRLVVDLVEHIGHRYEQEVITKHLPDPPNYTGLEVHEYKGAGMADAVRTHLQRFQPEVVHVHYWGDVDRPWYDTVFTVAGELGVKVVENVNTPVDPYRADSIDSYVFVSDFVRTVFGHKDPREITIHPGSDFSHFSTDDGRPAQGDSVGMVYRLEGDKLNLDSIKPFVEVARRRPGTSMLIVGGGTFLEPYRRYADEQGVLDAFEFTGYVPYDDLPTCYKRLAIFVAPVWKESFGQVSCFAMNMGIPVVGYDVGGLAEIVDDPSLLAPPDDPAGLADIIINLLKDTERRRAIALRNQARARELFSVEHMVGKYEELYDALLMEPT